MKIKKIGNICGNSATVYFDGRRDQYLSNGCAFYKIDVTSDITEDILLAILDVPADKRDGFIITYRALQEDFAPDGYSSTDKPMQVFGPAIRTGTRELRALRTEDGETLLIDGKYLAPLADEEDRDQYLLRETEGGLKWLCVTCGFNFRAGILPAKIGREITDQLQEICVAMNKLAEE